MCRLYNLLFNATLVFKSTVSSSSSMDKNSHCEKWLRGTKTGYETAKNKYNAIQTGCKSINLQFEKKNLIRGILKILKKKKEKYLKVRSYMVRWEKAGQFQRHTATRNSICTSAQKSSRWQKHINSTSNLSYTRVNWY